MPNRPFPTLTADEAAAHIDDGAMVGFSGFTPAGACKAVPRAIARRAAAEHAAGRPFRIKVLTGASTGKSLDDALAQADAVSWRAPYQSSPLLRKKINAGDVQFVDMHLSHVQQCVSSGFFGPLDVAVAEATEVTADGRVFLTTSSGATPTYLKEAAKVIIELNGYHDPRLREMHDVAIMPRAPHRAPIEIHGCMERIGTTYAQVDPSKIIGVVETHEPDEVTGFDAPDEASAKIAGHVLQFLLAEIQAGRMPSPLVLQSGVGNVANAVLAALGDSPHIPPFYMYTEVFQDALVDLMKRGKLLGASSTSLTLTRPQLERIYADMDFFCPRIVLRPQEYSNHPGVVRRLGVISTNTALEVDIYGHVNSTHVSGTSMMNGIGGSGDFTRNAHLSVFMCPSLAKAGAISTIVPMCSHVDHNEHSVQVVVTDQGLADLRGLDPIARARMLIDTCAHPAYRPYLREYLAGARAGHVRHDLARCFELHRNLIATGHMLPELGRL
jgi:acetyl-CoA hydrolase